MDTKRLMHVISTSSTSQQQLIVKQYISSILQELNQFLSGGENAVVVYNNQTTDFEEGISVFNATLEQVVTFKETDTWESKIEKAEQARANILERARHWMPIIETRREKAHLMIEDILYKLKYQSLLYSPVSEKVELTVKRTVSANNFAEDFRFDWGSIQVANLRLNYAKEDLSITEDEIERIMVEKYQKTLHKQLLEVMKK
jgi:hypothetical protein